MSTTPQLLLRHPLSTREVPKAPRETNSNRITSPAMCLKSRSNGHDSRKSVTVECHGVPITTTLVPPSNARYHSTLKPPSYALTDLSVEVSACTCPCHSTTYKCLEQSHPTSFIQYVTSGIHLCICGYFDISKLTNK